MRDRNIGRDEALNIVREKRGRVQPNKGFWKQLEVWERCGYEVWEVVDGGRREKEDYAKWKEDAERKMRDRVESWQ